MTLKYSQRSLVVLSLLGILSAVMSVLSVILIFQLRSVQTGENESPPSTSSLIPAPIWAVLLPVSTVLCALSLTLHLSSVVVCLLHGYFSTEVCRGEDDAEREDWFLLDSRAVRHVAIGLFCLGVSVYLAAMSIFMLLIFEVETGVASACVLSSGILVLLVVVIHTLVKASRGAKRLGGGAGDRLGALFHNDPPAPRHRELKVGVDKPRMPRSQSRLQQQMSYPPCGDPRPQPQYQQPQYPAPGGPRGHAGDADGDADGYSSGGGSGSRMHRTLSTESGLLQAQAQPWNGVNNEMRSVLARKSGISAKDSTLV